MEFASCYDQSGTVLASSIFLTVTAVFIVLAGFAALRLIAISGRMPVEKLQAA